MVWDADALNLLSAHPDLLPLPDKDLATPHPGEAARLLAAATSFITGDPLAAVQALQARLGCTVLLKGARTLMTDGVHTAANVVGSPAMAKGGSGDVLTGLIAGLCAQRILPDSLTLLQCAALLHGMAGARGNRSTTPEELCGHLMLPD